jgi:hypothetical protein
VFTFAVIRSGDTTVETSVEYLVAGFGSRPGERYRLWRRFPGGDAVLFAAGEDEKLISVEVSGDTPSSLTKASVSP